MAYVKKIVSYAYRIMFNFIATVTRPVPKTVLFESFSGKLPGDSRIPSIKRCSKRIPIGGWYLASRRGITIKQFRPFPMLSL